MKKAGALSVFILLILVVANLLYAKPAQKPEVIALQTETPPSRMIYVGAWVGGSWENNTKVLNIDPILKFEENIGKKLAITNMFADWTYLSNPALIDDLDALSQHGWTPMLSSNPLFFDGCRKTDISLYATIARGDCDEFLKSVALNLREFQKPVLLRFAWEMNLPNMYWSTQKLGSNPTEFIHAWQHFHTIVKQYAPNVVWVLSFNTTNSNTTPYKDLYPGDDYVDWVAIDGYNWGNTHSWSGWASFDGTFRNSYKELTAITKKPVMLSEVNSAPTGTGGDKATWLTDMLEKQIPISYTQVGAVVFFNENKQDGESVDWRLEKSPAYLSAVKNALKGKIYVSVFP